MNKNQLTQNNIDDIVYRNEVLCELLKFKQYLPHHRVKEYYQALEKRQLRWWVIPSIGNFSSLELRFHCDWRWLMSAVLEFKKYVGADTMGSPLYFKLQDLINTKVLHITMHDLYVKLTDYAIEVYKQKQLENVNRKQ